ncbi:MAG: TonB family protein [Prevotella sp.]|nr:TonB family protein [Prevotella sp.]
MMTLFLTYELKVAVLVAVFYIFWRLLVANETWHRLNRIVLLSTALASFVLPFCVITIHQTVEVMPPVADTFLLPTDEMAMPMESAPSVTNAETVQPFNWQLPLTIIYIIGVVVVLSKMLLSLWRLHRMRAESEIHPLSDGYRMAVCEKVGTPFSWWNTVFMNHNDYEKGVPALLTHELGHLRLHHSADVLLVELLTALQWFNPTMWMLRADLRTIHEYEADQQVLSHGFNDIQYLQLLIRKAAGQGGYSLANGISNSALKKRVTMIMKPKSIHRQWLRYAYLLPIVAVSLAMSARIQKDEVVNIGSSEVTDDVAESLADDNRLILLIDDLDDLKKVVAEKGKTRKMKANLDFNDHFTQKSMDGKTIIVHLPKGSMYVNDKESKKIDADINYAFPKGGFEWQLNGVPFDESNIPALHFKALKKIENHWNGKKNAVNLVTMSGQPLNEIVVVAEAPATDEPADDKPFIAKGFVYDSDEDKSSPIVGAVILVDGTKKGTVTDREGKFQIEVSMGDKITASYVGYESKTIGVSKVYSESSKSGEYYIGLHKESESVDPEKVYDVVEEMPEFPGGPAALYETLVKSIQYPEEARIKGAQGRAIVTFVVEKDGSISNARMVKSVDPSLDAEALRVVNSMPKWNPGKQNGEPVRVKYTAPVRFSLDAARPAAKPAEGYVLEIDGKVADDAEIANIPSGEVVSMEVVPAQNGQPKKIVITTKKKK